MILPKPLPTPVGQYGSLGGYTVVGRPGFPGQRPSKPRRIEPASNQTTANNAAANRNANSQAASSNSAANRPPNQPSATAAGRSLQIISSSEVARSSNQGEVQTRPIEVICGPGGEASVRCEGTLSEVEDQFYNILSHLSFNRRMYSRFKAYLPMLPERIQPIGLPSLKS